MEEIRYKVYQYDTMVKVWQLLHILYDRDEAVRHAKFWGNYSIVEMVDPKGTIDIIHVTGE